MEQTFDQKQVQTQAQTQQISTLQVALSGLVQLPVAELAERVRNEMMDNAALEEADGSDDFASEEERDFEADEWEDAAGGEISDSLGDYMNADEVPAYLQARADEARQQRENMLTGSTSAYEDLVRQIGEHDLTPHEQMVMDYLIGSLDDDGFLRKELYVVADELTIYHNVETDEEEVERLLHILQSFDPRGIGARSLQECLRLQLEDRELQSPYKALALKVVERSFKDFVGKRWDVIAQRYEMDEETCQRVAHLLTHLNPRPGSALGSGSMTNAPAVIPDFYVSIGSDGLPEIELNGGEVPDLHVSRAFRDSLEQFVKQRTRLTRAQHDAYIYAKQKVESAQTFITLLERRRQTLMAVMQTIVAMQQAFFVENDDDTRLRPMTLRDVPDRVAVDISPVSPKKRSNYVQTDIGIYPLKHFFSLQFTSAETGEEVSSRQVREAIREIVAAEDKGCPLSDLAIVDALRERGLIVARRTVAKYREQLGILVARLRKNRI